MTRNFNRCAPSGLAVLGREMDQLFHHLFPVSDGSVSEGLAVPVDVSETDTGYELTMDLPGFNPEQVNVEFKDNVLTISGERQNETQSSEKNYHRVERRFGSFSRSFRFKNLDGEKIHAEFKHGVLRIVAEKLQSAAGRKIDIKTA